MLSIGVIEVDGKADDIFSLIRTRSWLVVDIQEGYVSRTCGDSPNLHSGIATTSSIIHIGNLDFERLSLLKRCLSNLLSSLKHCPYLQYP